MKKLIATIVSIGVIGMPFITFAVETIKNPIKYNTFSDLVLAVTKAAVEVMLPFIVIAFIYTGYLFVKAQGKSAEIEKAQTSLLWSSIGAAILLGAWGFAQIIGKTISTITTSAVK